MSRLFISHSSQNDDCAIALRDWLIGEGWSGADDIFLDLDPERGIAAGQRWTQALEDAATRCEAVLFIVSQDWLTSKWCGDEYQLANKLNKRLFALVIDEVALDRLPGGLSAQWQVVRLRGEPAERFMVTHPLTQRQSPVYFAVAGFTSLKRGLEKAGIAPETFELQRDPNGPFGWRAPYRGLESLEPEDAAVFFGRSADIVRGIDALRGLAAHKPPRLLVILGASGAGKSSYLRAGLWPRLLRDDGQWLPLRAIRAGRGGAIEGGEGLLAALEELHQRFALRISRADLRQRLKTPESFVALLRELRQAAGRRALLAAPPDPLPVLCLDQAEEIFAADAGAESDLLLHLVRAASDAGEALLLVTIRSDSYGLMQNSAALAGVNQVPLSLGPVPHGEIARIIHEPAEILRRKAGPAAPAFDAAVIERLQSEIEGETDALPLLAFVLQRLMREHAGASTIGLKELELTGGVAAAIESAADAALADAGFGVDRTRQREALRRLFIPRLARIDRESRTPQRRVARQGELPSDLLPLARALTQRRLLVVKLAAQADNAEQPGAATLEVAHEALLRRWPTLAELLAEDRDALLLLDGVLSAAADWDKAEAERKPDFLTHRGSRLADALALAARGPDWEREIAPARAYLDACRARENAEREEREKALARTARLQRRWLKGVIAAAAVFAVLAVAAGGLFFVAEKQRNDALIAQSSFLAQQSLAATAEGNATRGALLALAALPKNLAAPDRPFVKRAEFALEHAMANRREGAIIRSKELINAMAFSPDGKRLVIGGGDKIARVVDAGTGKEVLAISLTSPARDVGFSRDGTRVITFSDNYQDDKEWQVWNPADGRETFAFKNRDIDDFILFSPDRRRVFTRSKEGLLELRDTATGALIKTWTDKFGLRFSPDSKTILAFASGKVVQLWDGNTGVLRQELAPIETYFSQHHSAFSNDGSRVVLASNVSGIVEVFETASGEQVARLDTAFGSGFFNGPLPAMSPDMSRLVLSHEQTVQLWDVAAGTRITSFTHESSIEHAFFSADGTRLVTTSAGRVRLTNAQNGAEVVSLRGADQKKIPLVLFSPDGKRLLVAFDAASTQLLDAQSGRQLANLTGIIRAAGGTAFSPDARLVVTASDDGAARLWDVKSGRLIALLRDDDDAEPEKVFTAIFSPDGSRIATRGYQIVRVWSVEPSAVSVFRGHAGAVYSALLSVDGKRLLTASADKTARIWDVASKKTKVTLAGHAGEVYSAAFSPDERLVVTASADKTARVWDAATGAQRLVLSGHEGPVRSAAFSPDGQRIVTASDDKTARLWDAKTGAAILTFYDHKQPVTSAVFSPDGTHVLSASWAEDPLIWDAHPGPTIQPLQRLIQDAHHKATWSDMVDKPGVTAAFNNIIKSAEYRARASAAMLGWGQSFAAYSPEGTQVVATSRGALIELWDVATGVPYNVLGLQYGVGALSARFSPRGPRVVTTLSDGTVQIWQVKRETPFTDLVDTLNAHDGAVHSAAYSGQGTQVVAAFDSGVARIWDAPRCEALVDRATHSMPRELTGREQADNFIGPQENPTWAMRVFAAIRPYIAYVMPAAGDRCE